MSLLAGKYVLGKLLGQGGYGSVYEGENVDLGKKVAIKLIDPQKKSSPEAVARFRREARLAGKIESPHIVQIFDVGEDETLGLFIVMELLRGEDLRQKLDRVGKLPVEGAVEFAHQIACGLARAHAAGVLHRDLKPANVFLHQVEGEPAIVKIVDFGIAKLLTAEGQADARDAQPLTSFGQTMGTPQYMAPEQVQGFPFDHRVDVWALGALLYEMVAGRPAYAMLPTFQETAVAIVTQSPPSLAEIAPSVPPAVAQVIMKALERDQSARVADAATFADMLVAALPAAFARPSGPSLPPISVPPASRPGAAPPAERPRLELVVEPSARRRRSVGVVLVVFALLAAGGLLVFAAMRPRAHEPAPVVAEPRPSAAPEQAVSAPTVSVAPSPPEPVPSPSASTPRPLAKPKPKPSFGGTGVSSEY